MLPETAPVSVIIPAYNAAERIRRALLSVAGQTLCPAEVVIVDDGSNDGTPEIAEEMRDTLGEVNLIVIRQENQGAGAARNRAIQAATQQYLAFIDADDEWLPTKLERSMAIMNSGDFVLVAHDYLDQGETNAVHVTCAERFNSYDDPYIGLYLKGFIPSISVVVQRQSVIDAGGFDESLRNAQDFELWLNLLSKPGTPFIIFNEALAKYFHTPGGIMSHTERRITCCVEVAQQYLPALQARRPYAHIYLFLRLINIYFEAFSTYVHTKKYRQALTVPFRLIAMIIKSVFPRSLLTNPIVVISLSVWVVVIFGMYIRQFSGLFEAVYHKVFQLVGWS
jgi:glycosyltransferase involved in cell wall biosynthesis